MPLFTLRIFHVIFHAVLKKIASKTVFRLFVSIVIFLLNLLVHKKVQGVFFYWSPLNLAKSQSLYEIPYSKFFSQILLLVLGLGQI